MVNDEVMEKAQRRIRRFIKTGEHQARVHQISRRMYEYKLVHHVESLIFRKGVFGKVKFMHTLKRY